MKKLLSILLAAAMLLTLCACSNNVEEDENETKKPAKKTADFKSVAVEYAEATIEGDMEAMLSLMAGEAQEYHEEVYFEDEDYRDEEFEWLEDECADADIDVTIDSFSDYYAAYKELAQVENEDYYGEYSIDVEAWGTENMDDDTLEALCVLVDDPTCEDYIDCDAISDGKFVIVKVYLDGTEESVSDETVVSVVKYDGEWKVLECGLYTAAEDYDWDTDKEEAYEIFYNAKEKALGNDDDDYDDEYDDDYDFDDYYIDFSDPEAVAQAYAEADALYDMETISEVFLFDFQGMAQEEMLTYYDEESLFEDASEEYGTEIGSWDEFWDAMHQSTMDEYGDPTVFIEVLDYEEMSSEELEEGLAGMEELVDMGYLDADLLDEVTEGCTVTVEITIDGDYESDVVEYEVILVLADYEWKVVSG